MTASSLPETLSELNALCRYFMDAESKIRQGEPVDMTGLDRRVKEICQTVQNSMVDQQQQYLPELTALLGLLSSCEAALLAHPPKDGDHDA